MRLRAEAGFGLILLIALTALSAILISATSMAFATNARALQLRIDKVKSYYLAQAGVMQAMQDWRDSSDNLLSRRFSPLNVAVTGAQVFKVSQCTSDFALHSLNAADWLTGAPAPNRRLQNLRITNISTTTSFEVTHIRVLWTPVNAARLQTVQLDGNVVLPSGSYANGATLALTGSPAARTRAPGENWSGSDTFIQWTVPPPLVVNVTVEWTFADNGASRLSRSHRVTYWNGSRAAGPPAIAHSFALTSTGQVNQTFARTLKTVKAVVSAAVMEIVDWDDVEQNQP